MRSIASAFEEMLLAMRQAQERIERLEQAIRVAVPDWSLAEVVTALMAMPGIDFISATAFLAEIGDLSRFPTPREDRRSVAVSNAARARVLPEADRKIDARSQTQDSPRRTSGHAAQIRGSEHDHRRLKASPPPLHDHNLDSFQLGSWGEDAEPRVRRLTREIRAKIAGVCSCPRNGRWRIIRPRPCPG
jgi:hypothetical protein